MGKLLKVKIDVTKIEKSRLFKGTKGTYLDIDIWINDEMDSYGNDGSVQQSTKKDEKKIYIGNCKWQERPANEPKKEVIKEPEKEVISDMNDDSDLPF